MFGLGKCLNICFEKDKDGSDLAIADPLWGYGFPALGCIHIAFA